jgi:hypothetical protein
MKNKLITCPFCKDEFPANCEYVDIGVGWQQVTANFCQNCHAYELSPYYEEGIPIDCEVVDSWCRKIKTIGQKDGK